MKGFMISPTNGRAMYLFMCVQMSGTVVAQELVSVSVYLKSGRLAGLQFKTQVPYD